MTRYNAIRAEELEKTLARLNDDAAAVQEVMRAWPENHPVHQEFKAKLNACRFQALEAMTELDEMLKMPGAEDDTAH